MTSMPSQLFPSAEAKETDHPDNERKLSLYRFGTRENIVNVYNWAFAEGIDEAGKPIKRAVAKDFDAVTIAVARQLGLGLFSGKINADALALINKCKTDATAWNTTVKIKAKDSKGVMQDVEFSPRQFRADFAAKVEATRVEAAGAGSDNTLAYSEAEIDLSKLPILAGEAQARSEAGTGKRDSKKRGADVTANLARARGQTWDSTFADL